MKDEPLFDVVIYNKETRIIDAVIGRQMRKWDGSGSGRNTAELRVQTGEERINERYGCCAIPAGDYNKGDAMPKGQP